MSKESPLYPSEDSHCFWQAFVFAKYTGDTENGRKKKSLNLIKWYCLKIHLSLELRVLFFHLNVT